MTPTLTHPLDTHTFTRVTVGPLTLWWSYEDCVAFQTPDANRPYAAEGLNLSPTTRRHIESLGNSWELSPERFNDALASVIDRYTK
jgi:hypothetical protein